MSAIIFAGPSLPPAARPAAPGIDWRPPVRQGDVYRAALERPAAIGVIDGVFEVTPTVWHKEILWAMEAGIRVYGAASIGALRAAELADFGMIGVGDIYRQFRDGTLEDDDEVALLHGPEEMGYVPLTEAMVNVRATVARAVADEIVGSATGLSLIKAAKRLFFKKRRYADIVSGAADRGADRAQLSRLSMWLPLGRRDIKRSDANNMVESIFMASCPEAPPCRASHAC